MSTKFFRVKSILFSIALLDFMGFTIAATLFPMLFLSKSVHFAPSSWTHTTRLLGVGIALGLYPLGQFLSASVFGVLSDRLGRKPVLVSTTTGTILFTLCAAISIAASIYYLLFISRFMLGLFAGNVSVAQASMADISDEKERASNISLIQLSLGLAWVFGAPLGSLLSDSHLIAWFSYSTPFYALCIVWLGILLLISLFYQETLLKRSHKIQKLHPLKGLVLAWDALHDKRTQNIFLTWLIFIGGWALFLQFLPTFLTINFHYTAHIVGSVMAFMGGTFAGTQIFIARYFLRRVSAESILRWVMLVPGLSALAIGITQSEWVLSIGIFSFPFSMGFTLPALLSAISNHG